MTVRTWMRRVFKGTHTDGYAHDSEQDVPGDPDLASSRATGGRHALLDGDRGSVTGTGDTDEYVGQVAGDDLGYADETGAERRAEAGEQTSTRPADETGR